MIALISSKTSVAFKSQILFSLNFSHESFQKSLFLKETPLIFYFIHDRNNFSSKSNHNNQNMLKHWNIVGSFRNEIIFTVNNCREKR